MSLPTNHAYSNVLTLAPLAVLTVPITTSCSEVTPLALAYLRARQADPMCSFGDFAAVSDIVDVATAMVLKKEVSDGIIAPGYEPEALAILASKKGGKFIVLTASENFTPPPVEYREVYGAVFSQKRNETLVTAESMTNVITTKVRESILFLYFV